MLDVLVSLIREALKKIFDVSIEKLATKVSAKRSLAIALLELYDATVKLEESSRTALDLFQSYQNGAVPLRIRAREAMDSLVTSVETFDKRLRDVYSKLQLYNPHLATVLVSRSYGKSHTLEIINVLLAATPRIKMDAQYPTDDVIIPTALPDRALLGRADIHYGSKDDERIAELKRQIDKSLKKRDVNYSAREDLAFVLRNGEFSLRQIEAARRELAEFIQQNVPLAEILMD